MKIMTILGTRPEIIRLSLIIRKLDKYFEHIFVHTNQNYGYRLNELFFEELGVRKPDYMMDTKSDSFGEQAGKILAESEKIMRKENPDAILILGDTNSGLSSIIAKRLGIPIVHMEAGNRCYDYRVPEEINRRIIDHCSTIQAAYTYRSKENLVREGIRRDRIFVVGNPILEVLNHFSEKIDKCGIMEKLSLKKDSYFLVTLHRAENVGDKERLKNFFDALGLVHDKYKLPIICSVHPRTKDRMDAYGISAGDQVRLVEPLSFFEFVNLEKNAFCVMTDSGTVQEECCIFNKPNVTLRDVTERPETSECGSNILGGNDPDRILNAVEIALGERQEWSIPGEYNEKNVSSKIIKLIQSFDYKELKYD